jgi:glycosyltransferase involved in cell wall biosynthesis
VKPLVTIAVPTYNRPDKLREAVASALDQSYRNVEVLIGDNGASETVRAWSQRMAERDSRLRYQSYPTNLGMAGNWNALADRAQGELFLLLADDDRLLQGFVETLVTAFQRHDGVLAFSNHYLIDGDGRRLEEESRHLTRQYHRDILAAGRTPDPEACVWSGSISVAASLMRTHDVRRLRFKEDLNTPEIELFVRLAQEGGSFVFVPEYLSEYRVHPGSATAAGLWSERLAEYLLETPAGPQAESHKRSFMAPLLITAVNRCLERGERERARRLLASEYYPRPKWSHPQGVVHSLCARMPAVLGKPLLQLSRSAYRLRARMPR